MKSGYLYIEDHVLPTLFALSSEEQSKGLMHQEWPPPTMSFVYLKPSVNKFWMKNTPSPLDIVFSHQGVINQIHHGESNSTRVIGDDMMSDLIVEFPRGTIESHNFKLGHRIGIAQPTLEELKKIILQIRGNY